MTSYLFVDNENLNAVVVYAPRASDRARPTATIALWSQHDPIRDIVTDAEGRLYVLDVAGTVDVFDEPLRRHTQPDRVLRPQGKEFSFGAVMAVDRPQNELYVNFWPSTNGRPMRSPSVTSRDPPSAMRIGRSRPEAAKPRKTSAPTPAPQSAGGISHLAVSTSAPFTCIGTIGSTSSRIRSRRWGPDFSSPPRV